MLLVSAAWGGSWGGIVRLGDNVGAGLLARKMSACPWSTKCCGILLQH